MTAKLVNLKLLKRQVSPEIFHEFCRESNICPECLTETLTISKDDAHEIVCSRCGLVVGQEIQQPHKLPGYGERTNYNDTCNLAFGKSLGTHLKKYELFSVIAKNGTKDLGIRGYHVRNLLKTEIPQVERMLSYGSHLCKKYGLDGDDNKSIIFADYLGKVLRSVAITALVFSRGSIQAKRLAEACFLYCYRKNFHDGVGLEELEVEDELLNWIDTVMHKYALPPKGVEIFGKKKRGDLPRNVIFYECPDDLPVLRFKPKAQKN